MPKATWNGAVIAQADTAKVQIVEGNVYFPPEAVNKAFFKDSQTHTDCSWKGTASYHDVVVDGKINKDAAWYYSETKDAAKHIKDFVAFWKGVEVTK